MSITESEANASFFAEFLEDYFAECEEHLTALRRALLALEGFVSKPSVNRPLLDDLFRSFHSLKGISAMVGVRDAEQLAHQMESYLRALRQNEVALTPEGMGALFDGTKMLEQVVASRRLQNPQPDIGPVLSQLAATISNTNPAAPDTSPDAALPQPGQAGPGRERVWRFEFAPSPLLAGRGVNVNTIRARLEEIGELLNAAPRVKAGAVTFEFVVSSEVDEAIFAAWRDDGLSYEPVDRQPASGAAPAERAIEPALPASARASANVVRVDLTRLDGLMQMVGELVISRARLDENLKRAEREMPAGEWRAIQETNLAMERQLRDLREGVMRARMVPIGEIFERMRFVVRDLAREKQRAVILEMSGQETEIDKFLVERMMDPLLHLVRNAVSHGLESVAERAAQGKPAEAKVALRASTSGETVVIEIEDDGRGIDPEHVKSRAADAGLIARDAAVDSQMLLNLICAPGFSTREEADRASGRGVGMAVVRETVLELGGTLALETEVGRGTLFTIHLPLTLAIADAFIVNAGGQTFAVPQTSVREVIEIDPASVIALEKNEILYYRGGVLPLLNLARFFRLAEKSGRAFYALVVGSQPNPIGIMVDRILGQREIVVRTLSDPLVQVAGISGATELGDGRIVLILDAADLAASASEQREKDRSTHLL